MVNAILYQARTGCQWRYLPGEFGSWNTIWRTFCRWRDRGLWQEAMDVLRRPCRRQHNSMPEPSMVMVDTQVSKGGRAGRDFHQSHAKYYLRGAKRVVAGAHQPGTDRQAQMGAHRHEVGTARDLLDYLLPFHPRVSSGPGDRGFPGLEGPGAREHGVRVEIKHRDQAKGEFKPIRPLWRVEDCFAEQRRWRRLSRSFEATPASATAWMQVACVGWLLSMI